MGDHIHFLCARPGSDLLYEVVQADRRVLDIEPVGSDLLAAQGKQSLGEILVRRRLEGGGGLVIEPVDPQRRRIQCCLRIRIVEDLLLAATDVDFVPFVSYQPDQRALELVESRGAISVHADMS